MADNPTKRKVLVYGDAMIDRSWIISEPAETSQQHAGIVPQKVVPEKLRTTRPGGAGLTAAWLAHVGFDVQLLARGGGELHPLLQESEVKFFPDWMPPKDPCTIKFRIYADRGADLAPDLRHRFDFDVIAEPLELPKAIGEVDCVVVADFCKGGVNPNTLRLLAEKFPEVSWFVDSKNENIVSMDFADKLKVPPTLFVNRDELGRVMAAPGTQQEAPRLFTGQWHTVERNILDAAANFHSRFPHWDLVVKLDEDGAAAFWCDGASRDGSWMFTRAAEKTLKGSGIGAGDAFIAGWAHARCQPSAAIKDCLVSGVNHATAWIERSESLRELTMPSKVELPPTPGASLQVTPRTLQAREEELDHSGTMEALMSDGELDLGLASGHCGQFMTRNLEVGKTVRTFAAEISAFFASSGERHPLNCLMWAEPGSGKSFLAEEVAKEVGAKFHEINISTLTSRSELNQQLEKAKNLDQSKILVLIDECAAALEGVDVYPALLAPLWSKTRTKKLVFLLVDSYNEVSNVEGFVKHIASGAKGTDLVSRLNGPRITLQAPNDVDRAVLVASLIRRLHKHSAFKIEVNALKSLVGKPRVGNWSPRATEYIIEAVRPTRSAVHYSDLVRIRALCNRLGVELQEPSEDGKKLIRIKDPPKGKDA